MGITRGASTARLPLLINDQARKHHRRAITVIERHDIRFAPKVITNYPEIPSITAGFVPSERDHERVALLAKILYLEAFLHLYVSGLPGARVWANHDHEDIPFSGQTFSHSAIAMEIDSLTRMKLIARGSECLQHMLGLARKYSDIGDRDRCMILRSNTLLTITGLLELYRSVLEDGVVPTTEELSESRQKCGELLVLLADTSL